VLLLKLLLVPGLVAAVTLAVRRWGPAVGGWLAGLPVVAGPVLVFYAIEQGPAFAAQAAHATLAGLIATVAFAVAYARCSVRLRWYACVAVGWTAFVATIFTLYVLEPALVSSLVSLIAATVLGRRGLAGLPRHGPAEAGPYVQRHGVQRHGPAEAGPHVHRDGPAEAGPYVHQGVDQGVGAGFSRPATEPAARPRGDLVIRLVATATLVLVLTGLAERMGATLSGLLNAFPVLTTIIAAFTHAQRGRAAVVAFLNGYLQAIVGFALFCVVMALALNPLGLAPALAAALAVQLAAHGFLLWTTSRFSPVSG
jgi:hypothetical protein